MITRRGSVREEQRYRSFVQHGPCHGAEEDLSQNGLAMGTHHEQAAHESVGLFEDHAPRFLGGFDRKRHCLELVILEKLERTLGSIGRDIVAGVDADHVNLARFSQAGRREGGQGERLAHCRQKR